ncbi:MAG: phosphoribosylformylglycinamidine synthase subunit PurL [Actinomycetota bacterium]
MKQGAALPEALHRQLGLTDDEYDRIVEILGRDPNHPELAMYSVMWSEHCSYKSSRVHLRRLPTEGKAVMIGPGEGAGVVRVGDYAVALRLESHNHPSFVEPFQGAATGIGGIVRDVLSMGARPIALLDPLRFGPPPGAETKQTQADETAERNRFLVEGVVSGISSYGNCIGVPTVGGEIKFDNCYSGNPLVNVMCIGVAAHDGIVLARAEGVGNKVLLLGSSTGRDGIGGVSVLASATFDETASEKRPSVQVGDPFTEKLLIEACLQLIDDGLVVGIQDLGGAGLCCATSETAAKAGTGMKIDLSKVPLREPSMEPFEILTSESQERMLVIVTPSNQAAALAVCERWGLAASVIGEVTATGSLEVLHNGDLVADVPAASLGDGPVYERPMSSVLASFGDEPMIDPAEDLSHAMLTLLASADVASKSWAWEQYDHQVLLGTIVKPGRDAAVIRLSPDGPRIAVTTDGIGHYCQVQPREGAAHTVAESYRNLSAMGAEPIAITNCMNFGSPERPEVMWQFSEVIDGMSEACQALGTPVTGGNVSFYNETMGESIFPTPVVGMLGVLSQGIDPPRLGFAAAGDVVAVIGETIPGLGASAYHRTIHGRLTGPLPVLDLAAERANGTFVRKMIAKGAFRSCHDCSEGGLAVALLEACLDQGVGAQLTPHAALAIHEWLFSESPGRYLISLDDHDLGQVQEAARSEGVFFEVIGTTGDGGLQIATTPNVRIDIGSMRRAWGGSFASYMGYEAQGGLI